MDLEKLAATAAQLGLTCAELREWVEKEQARQRDKRAAELEAVKAAAESQRLADERQRQILKLKLKLQEGAQSEIPAPAAPVSSPKLPFFNTQKLLPLFDERRDDLHASLQRFERVATGQDEAGCELASKDRKAMYIKELIELGESMGLEKAELRDWVEHQRSLECERRAAEREMEKARHVVQLQAERVRHEEELCVLKLQIAALEPLTSATTFGSMTPSDGEAVNGVIALSSPPPATQLLGLTMGDEAVQGCLTREQALYVFPDHEARNVQKANARTALSHKDKRQELNLDSLSKQSLGFDYLLDSCTSTEEAAGQTRVHANPVLNDTKQDAALYSGITSDRDYQQSHPANLSQSMRVDSPMMSKKMPSNQTVTPVVHDVSVVNLFHQRILTAACQVNPRSNRKPPVRHTEARTHSPSNVNRDDQTNVPNLPLNHEKVNPGNSTAHLHSKIPTRLGIPGNRFVQAHTRHIGLTDLTKKGQSHIVSWGPTQENAFAVLKVKLAASPILQAPDLTKPFVLRTDASNTSLGAVLLQTSEDSVLHPVAYASRNLLPRETRYSTIERECLALVWAVQKFHIYLCGKPFVIQCDHQPLQYLQSAKHVNNRVLRWSLLMQEYSFTVEYIKGSNNVGADYLSRI